MARDKNKGRRQLSPLCAARGLFFRELEALSVLRQTRSQQALEFSAACHGEGN